MDKVVIFGYSGHAYVVCDIFAQMGVLVAGYCDVEEKKNNPFGLKYFGNEKVKGMIQKVSKFSTFVSVGDNVVRKNIMEFLKENGCRMLNAIHPHSVISPFAKLGNGVMISAGVYINHGVGLGFGAICNTGCIIEHECSIGDFTHIAPAAVLCGNVTVGENCFIGANSVIIEGIKIGNNATIGAGTVVIKNIDYNTTVVGNPQRTI